jgi:hypothetical protein
MREEEEAKPIGVGRGEIYLADGRGRTLRCGPVVVACGPKSRRPVCRSI